MSIDPKDPQDSPLTGSDDILASIPPELRGPSIEDLEKRDRELEEAKKAKARNRLGKKERQQMRVEKERAKFQKLDTEYEKRNFIPVSQGIASKPMPKVSDFAHPERKSPISDPFAPKSEPKAAAGKPEIARPKSNLEALFAPPKEAADPKPMVTAAPQPSSGRILRGSFGTSKSATPPKATLLRAADLAPKPAPAPEPVAPIEAASPADAPAHNEISVNEAPKRKRGRPRKNPLPEAPIGNLPGLSAMRRSREVRSAPTASSENEPSSSEPRPPRGNKTMPSSDAEMIETKPVESKSAELVPAQDILPDSLIILPIAQRPILPGITVPLLFDAKEFEAIIQKVAESEHRMLGVSWARRTDIAEPHNVELCEVGTVVKIVKVMVNEGNVQLLARALHRFEKRAERQRTPFIEWEVEYRRDVPTKPYEELKAYTLSIISSVKELLNLSPLFGEQLKLLMAHLDFENPGLIMDLITAMSSTEPEKAQEVLETFDLLLRAKKVMALLKNEIDLQQLQMQIKSQIDDKISAHQKEFFLREQLKVIKKELGIEKDDKASEIEALEAKIAKLDLSAEARKVAQEELKKLSTLEAGSSEFNVVRTYLGWLTDLPWNVNTEDKLDLVAAKAVLDASHYGLDDVKDRILEFIATLKKRGSLMGSILCLVGPPGVGKTSVGKSIADALGREFYRFSLGGMRDEAEIKGHRRTYIGAMPGKLIQSLKRTGTSNPVIMLDEIDKLTSSYQGDPASALLEVLDPEQNREFLDHYLDVRFDLSKVLFLTTANTLDSIPAPLLDRMEVIKLSGYVLEEKAAIARNYLIPHQLTEHGLKASDLKIADRTLNQLIDQYAREAGVRNLENQIRKICRKVTRRHAEGQNGPLTLTSEVLQEFLGLPPFTGEELYNKGVPGTVLGLAWTSMGGATLYIEAVALLAQGGGFKTTGQLGGVMGESAQIAYSYVRHLASGIAGASDFFEKHMVHLHVPAGATPKDGPSAGVTMALALYSLVCDKAVKNPLAMTGELTITGKVLPIGGVREKIIAAKRVKVHELILPKDNQRDFDKLPAFIREGIVVHFADSFADVLQVAFEGKVPQLPTATAAPAQAPVATAQAQVAAPVVTGTAVKRRPGRPPRANAPVHNTSEIPAIPKRRGRPPRKVPPLIVSADSTPKRRGRPPKNSV